ncbi:MAG: hypothetical protein A3C02_04825 [Candidatus Andersenbacteria bacterium RIFCSPHIGHO2_02_FULL_45_11]|uniref:Uncharacterized protein n=1 Tax=Candidatus Andersenbacteria bacterium RIFCSPHIGHO2_12_FULL_45_11 TaxID=1797281 RepID=A0A1G1X0V7_9BACT|nr:MAG: hypothetical protein A2805_00915 [Candidatus Andersenbacteria bacterium RIFCSPHIGHO2_01_FULL_46_36]OGY31933.1 MAG: hypothetical protein A3C02_04825 [Candidatus Andersenbacteria bacterium RIFCSPHIGHO2_02_FULL_45_11]OGY33639.1 MAG: hypothetical protein A3D99_03770 [Candidatus Andersenbacteria bacterium RIFCSPHIGHO2_12_FULL_45_11]
MISRPFVKIFGACLFFSLILIGITISNTEFVENSQQSPTRDIGLLDPVEFNLPATAKEIPEKRTETSATFEISPGKFAAVSSGRSLLTQEDTHPFGFFARLIPSALALNAGPSSPGTITDITYQTNWTHCSGIYTWTSPSSAAGSDNTYATRSVTNGTFTSACLKATNFGFSIPDGATIDGVEVGIERSSTKSSGTEYTRDVSTYLVKGGVPSGDNKGDTATNWPTTEASATYGGAADMWGTTLTPANVNATDFGATLNVDTKAVGA